MTGGRNWAGVRRPTTIETATSAVRDLEVQNLTYQRARHALRQAGALTRARITQSIGPLGGGD